ncbi:MAG: tetratricopeptide repeat protein [Candidatus Riflebacteria bacterium]|nr:tetratricopeptide repeat protein [Candidatus Riflebacteria bacterium]
MNTIDPVKVLMNEGMDALKSGNLDEAESIFRDFLKSHPDSDLADNACYNLSKICLKRGDTKKAIEWLDYILKHYPDSDAAYFAVDDKEELLKELK